MAEAVQMPKIPVQIQMPNDTAADGTALGAGAAIEWLNRPQQGITDTERAVLKAKMTTALETYLKGKRATNPEMCKQAILAATKDGKVTVDAHAEVVGGRLTVVPEPPTRIVPGGKSGPKEPGPFAPQQEKDDFIKKQTDAMVELYRQLRRDGCQIPPLPPVKDGKTYST